MKYLWVLFFVLSTLQAQSFSKRLLLGSWEVSSIKQNASVAFGHYIGRERGEALEVVFNQRGRMQVLKSGEVYDYKIVNGTLKIFEVKTYGKNYRVTNKHRYDIFKIVGRADGCFEVKVLKKKIAGLRSRRNLQMCKMANIPQPTYQESKDRYKF